MAATGGAAGSAATGPAPDETLAGLCGVMDQAADKVDLLADGMKGCDPRVPAMMQKGAKGLKTAAVGAAPVLGKLDELLGVDASALTEADLEAERTIKAALSAVQLVAEAVAMVGAPLALAPPPVDAVGAALVAIGGSLAIIAQGLKACSKSLAVGFNRLKAAVKSFWEKVKHAVLTVVAAVRGDDAARDAAQAAALDNAALSEDKVERALADSKATVAKAMGSADAVSGEVVLAGRAADRVAAEAEEDGEVVLPPLGGTGGDEDASDNDDDAADAH